MLENYCQLVKKEVEYFEGKAGEPGVIEHHLDTATKELEKLEKEIKLLYELISYLKIKKDNLGD